MRWEDFLITLGPPDARGDCQARAESPLGEAGCTFSTLSLREWLSHSQACGTGLARGIPRAEAVRPPHRELGELLFNLIFSGRCRDLFHMTEGFVTATGRGLRIVFKIDLDEEGGPSLQRIPWELLYQPSKRQFVALLRNRSIVRHLQLLSPLRSAVLPSSARLLAVACLPAGLEQLDLAAETAQLRRIYGPSRLTVLTDPALTELQTANCTPGRFQIFHFMGHAGFAVADRAAQARVDRSPHDHEDIEQPGHATEDRSPKEGVLFFPGADATDPVNGGRLGTALNVQDGDFRLVFLNACRTADARRGPGSDPYGALGTALVIQSVPAVVGMRERISDPAAIRFSRRFHEQLAAGQTLDEAVNAGRRSLFLDEDGHATDEWSQPIVFLRSLRPSPPASTDYWGRFCEHDHAY